MAPTKATTRAAITSGHHQLQQAVNPILGALGAATRKGLTRRAAATGNIDPNVENMQTRAKRKADHSPIKNDKIKRSALGNLTNNVKIMTLHPAQDEEQSGVGKKPTAQQLQALMDAKKQENLRNESVEPATAAAEESPALLAKSTAECGQSHWRSECQHNLDGP